MMGGGKDRGLGKDGRGGGASLVLFPHPWRSKRGALALRSATLLIISLILTRLRGSRGSTAGHSHLGRESCPLANLVHCALSHNISNISI